MTHVASLRTALFNTPRLLVMAFVIALGLTIAGGAALVAAQRGEPGEPPSAASYQGCVNTYTGVLRIVAEGEQCAGHEMPIQLGGSGGDTALLERIETLEGTVATLQEENAALQAQVPDCLTTEGDEVYFTGCNVNIRNGHESGTTASVNGLGNLIVGYNENDDNVKTGSHNLVVGPEHTYSSYGGFVAGLNNAITEAYSSVGGGLHNTASGYYSSVNGGVGNTASSSYSSVSGGSNNTASGSSSSVSGGSSNTASFTYSNVSGGEFNTASGNSSSVSGGSGNTANGGASSITGGYQNSTGPNSVYATVSGGFDNRSNAFASSIGGGVSQYVFTDYVFVP